jgi:hypothetical protein
MNKISESGFTGLKNEQNVNLPAHVSKLLVFTINKFIRPRYLHDNEEGGS